MDSMLASRLIINIIFLYMYNNHTQANTSTFKRIKVSIIPALNHVQGCGQNSLNISPSQIKPCSANLERAHDLVSGVVTSKAIARYPIVKVN